MVGGESSWLPVTVCGAKLGVRSVNCLVFSEVSQIELIRPGWRDCVEGFD